MQLLCWREVLWAGLRQCLVDGLNCMKQLAKGKRQGEGTFLYDNGDVFEGMCCVLDVHMIRIALNRRMEQ